MVVLAQVAVNTTFTDLHAFLSHIVTKTNTNCLTPTSALDGPSSFLAANLYAVSAILAATERTKPHAHQHLACYAVPACLTGTQYQPLLDMALTRRRLLAGERVW